MRVIWQKSSTRCPLARSLGRSFARSCIFPEEVRRRTASSGRGGIVPSSGGRSPAAASFFSFAAAAAMFLANPDFRAERGMEIGLHGNWRGIDIPGRILLARALHAGFGGADGDFPAMGTLVSAERLARARQWGLAIRLAQRLTGGVEAPLKASSIALDDGRLCLRLNPGWHHLGGESVERRLRSLAQALGAKPELMLL